MTQEKKKAIENLLFLSLSVVSGSQGAFLSVDKDRNLLRFEAVAVCAGLLPIIDTISERLVGKSVPIGEGVTGRAAATREVQFATSADGLIFSRADGDGKPNAVLAVPVLKGEELVGVMTAVCLLDAWRLAVFETFYPWSIVAWILEFTTSDETIWRKWRLVCKDGCCRSDRLVRHIFACPRRS